MTKIGQPVLNPKQAAGEQLRWIIGTGDGDPKDDGQQEQHDRESGPFSGQQFVYFAVAGIIVAFFKGDRITAHLLCAEDDARNDNVSQLFQ